MFSAKDDSNLMNEVSRRIDIRVYKDKIQGN